MSRRLNRIFFGLSAAAAAGVVVVAIVVALGPTARPSGPTEIGLVRVDALRPNEVGRLVVKELSGLDRLANEERERAYPSIWGPRSRPAGMPIFVVRANDDGVHAFLGVDPRTGCDLKDQTVASAVGGPYAFVDVCHGTAYDLSGRPTRGPGPWFLDELVLHVRDGIVYAEPHKVIAGGIAVRY